MDEFLKRGGLWALALVLVFSGFLVLAIAMRHRKNSALPTIVVPTPSPVPAFNTGPAVQAEREKAIAELIKSGIVAGVSKRGEYPHLYVRPPFYELDFAAKQAAAALVAAYFWAGVDPGRHALMVYDIRTNKIVGQFDANGLTMN